MNQVTDNPSAGEGSGGGGSSRSWLRQALIALATFLVVGGITAFILSKANDDGGSSDSTKHTVDASSSNNAEVFGKDSFYLEVDADKYNGLTPLKVNFVADPYNAKGDVTYHWDFDEDGATYDGDDATPTYTYKKAGWKIPSVTVFDSAGRRFKTFYEMRVYTPSEFKRADSKDPKVKKAFYIYNQRLIEAKTGAPSPGVSGPPLTGQKPLTEESRRAAAKQKREIRKAQLKAAQQKQQSEGK